MKNSSKKCNITIKALQQLNSTSYARIFCTFIQFELHRLTTMMNFDATRNFVSSFFVNKKKLLIRKKIDAYNLMTINGDPLKDNNEIITKEITLLKMTFQQHYEELVLNVVDMINHDIVLRMS